MMGASMLDATSGTAEAAALARTLDRDLGALPAPALLHRLIRDRVAGAIALVSSFGIESAVLLHLVAGVDRNAPVLFLDTGMLFPETLAYRRRLTAALGLEDVRVIAPDPAAIARTDPAGRLRLADPDACCRLRKVAPLEGALAGFAAWINGRKRFHGGERGALPTIEAAGGRIKVNPLARWSREDIEEYARRHDLPRHPLHDEGYTSVGCAPCTSLPADPANVRAGRWRGTAKTECGIHRATQPA